nr:RluA family pseudouridine synthase [uncultured Dethiosulfovibrio sp.]
MDRFKVSSHQDGRRLDKVIRGIWPSLPLGAMMKAFRKKQVRVDGVRAAFDQRLAEGQEVVVPWEPAEEAVPLSNYGSLDTIYRDDHIWVIDKPPGLLSQPDSKGGDSVVTRAQSMGGEFKPQAVHRLDRNTSGVMILALSGKVLRDLSSMWRGREITKTYWALVSGDIKEAGRVDAPLLKDQDSNKVEVDRRGQDALTLYTPLARGEGCTLCEVVLVTGRSHQIRVHMAHIGHPLLGDIKYGPPHQRERRPMLHARSISLSMAATGDLFFEAPLTDDMVQACLKRSVDLDSL